MKRASDPLDDNRLTVNRDWVWDLHAAGLDTFEGCWAPEVGEVLRVAGKRANVRLKIATRQGTKTLFMKRHARPGPVGRLRGRMSFRGARSQARIEWENILRMSELGILTMTPVSLGEDPRTGRSFIITAEIDGAVPADDFARKHLAGKDAATVRSRRVFVRRLAELVGKLHRANLTHRDLYLCHVFVRAVGGDFRLYLIDLQRVAPCVLERWKVKDLAQLEFSRPEGTFTRADDARFLQVYFATPRLNREQKRFAAAARRKAQSIRRRENAKGNRR